MKKFILMILTLCFILSGCQNRKCDTNKGFVCYRNKTDSFELEEDLHLKVAVKNEVYGEALVALWNETYPEKAGAVEYEVAEAYTANYYLSHDDFDLWYISEEELPLLMNNALVFDENLSNHIEKYRPKTKDSLINYEADYFIPMEYYGYLFAYNSSLLEKIGIDLSDEDEDGLPEAFDTFEEIFSIMDQYEGDDVVCFYPISFKDKYTLYPLLTAGGFELFPSDDAACPGFDGKEFSDSLMFIFEAGQHQWYYQKDLLSSDYPYAFDDVLLDNCTLFTLIDQSSLYLISEEDGHDYCFSHMPSYKGHILSPLCDLIGYAINSNCRYKSGASELLRLIRTSEGLQIYSDTTDAVVYTSKTDITADENRRQKTIAYQYSVSEPLIALETDSTKRAWDMYYEIDFLPILRNLFDQLITVENAQDEFVRLSEEWLNKYGIEVRYCEDVSE